MAGKRRPTTTADPVFPDRSPLQEITARSSWGKSRSDCGKSRCAQK
jgi:hypothetical protein